MRTSVIPLLAFAACSGRDLTGDAGTDPGLDVVWTMDTDEDGISDADEGRESSVDTDGDTILDFMDTDSDDDGIPDSIEAGDVDIRTAPVDSDGDGDPDFRDLDSDGNDLLDEQEGMADTDGDGTMDFADPDNDGDGIDDTVEIGPDPSSPVDFDGDGVPDHRDLDSDNDRIFDQDEGVEDTDGDGLPDRHDLDSDDDGIPDSIEAGDEDTVTPPYDTDSDGVPDFQDQDSDADGLSDWWEHENGTDPCNDDSDGDGVPDLIEVGAGTDPLDPSDNPRTRGLYIFIMYYNDPGDPPIEPEPVVNHVFFTSSTAAMTLQVVLRDDPTDGFDATLFVDRVEPSTEGGYPDPGDPARICVAGLGVDDIDDDTVPDVFTDVPPDTNVCFDVYAMPNDMVEPIDDPLVFTLHLDVIDETAALVQSEPVYFVVPPYIFVPTPDP